MRLAAAGGAAAEAAPRACTALAAAGGAAAEAAPRACTALLPLALLVAACGSFEDENIVIDTRILAMKATLPDQVVDVDLENPQSPLELLAQLRPTRICALVADPGHERRLRWSMTMCRLGDGKCEYTDARVNLASGLAPDPEVARPAPELCATIEPNGNLLGLLLQAQRDDAFGGLGGLDYGVSFIVRGEDVDRSLDIYASKTLRVAPRIPAGRTANTNPHVERFDAQLEGGEPFALPLGRCVDQPSRTEVRPKDRLRIEPIEPDGVRETYVVPTLEGLEQQFTETLTYQWLASAGSFSAGSTGGPRDVAGNPAPLFTEYIAPDAADLEGPTDVQLWIIQRDERLGAEWYEACVRVVP